MTEELVAIVVFGILGLIAVYGYIVSARSAYNIDSSVERDRATTRP